jgi:hypothetical protein
MTAPDIVNSNAMTACASTFESRSNCTSFKCRDGYRKTSESVTCIKGKWTLMKCIEIDECAEQTPCHSEATCVDKIDAYVCECPPDRHGVHCNSTHFDCPIEGTEHYATELMEQCGHGECIDLTRDSHNTKAFKCNCDVGYEKATPGSEVCTLIHCPARYLSLSLSLFSFFLSLFLDIHTSLCLPVFLSQYKYILTPMYEHNGTPDT